MEATNGPEDVLRIAIVTARNGPSATPPLRGGSQGAGAALVLPLCSPGRPLRDVSPSLAADVCSPLAYDRHFEGPSPASRWRRGRSVGVHERRELRALGQQRRWNFSRGRPEHTCASRSRGPHRDRPSPPMSRSRTRQPVTEVRELSLAPACDRGGRRCAARRQGHESPR